MDRPARGAGAYLSPRGPLPPSPPAPLLPHLKSHSFGDTETKPFPKNMPRPRHMRGRREGVSSVGNPSVCRITAPRRRAAPWQLIPLSFRSAPWAAPSSSLGPSPGRRPPVLLTAAPVADAGFRWRGWSGMGLGTGRHPTPHAPTELVACFVANSGQFSFGCV